MDLYVIRHAPALAAGPSGSGTDADRPLSAAGRERFRSAVGALEGMGVRLDCVEHSPLLRAVQTAELLDPILDGARSAQEWLAGPPAADQLARLGGHRSLAVVGHAPFVSDLVALLRTEGHGARDVRFSKGAIAWLQGEPRPGGMTLRAFWPAETLPMQSPPKT